MHRKTWLTKWMQKATEHTERLLSCDGGSCDVLWRCDSNCVALRTIVLLWALRLLLPLSTLPEDMPVRKDALGRVHANDAKHKARQRKHTPEEKQKRKLRMQTP